MPDAVFADPRLAAVYDALDPNRSDLDAYLQIAADEHARRVLDLGCGTGVLALLLAERGLEVIGVDPARASLDVARGKPGADVVRWIDGDWRAIPALDADLAVMTGNAAQAITDDGEWRSTLAAVFDALRPGGLFVFETRDPAAGAWATWTPELTRTVTEVAGAGEITSWYDLLEVELPLVRFRNAIRFASDGTALVSESTLRFRGHDEVEPDLIGAGFAVEDVRDAPDRPGLELVFLARRRA